MSAQPRRGSKNKLKKLEKEVNNLAHSTNSQIVVARPAPKNSRPTNTNIRLDSAHKALILGMVKAELKRECHALAPTARRMVMMIISGGYFGGREVKLQRLMDQFSQPTAIVATQTIIDVVGNGASGTAASNKGKFGFMIASSPGQQKWTLSTQSINQDFTSASSGVGTAVGKNVQIACKAVYLDPTKTWQPSAAWDDGAWVGVNDSQSTELLGTFSAYTGIWAAGPGYGGGFIRQGRVVAMSAYFRCSEAALVNGGNVAISRLSCNPMGLVVPLNGPQTVPNAALATYLPPGNPMEWKSNAMLKPEVYTGLLKDGCYCWWMPPNSNSEPLLPANLATNQDPCVIYFSGQAAPDNAGVYASLIGELEINTVYEFTTSEQFLTKDIEPYDPEALKQAYAILAKLPAAMANDEHRAWITKMFKFLAGAAAGAAVLATGGAALPAIATGLATSKALFN